MGQVGRRKLAVLDFKRPVDLHQAGQALSTHRFDAVYAFTPCGASTCQQLGLKYIGLDDILDRDALKQSGIDNAMLVKESLRGLDDDDEALLGLVTPLKRCLDYFDLEAAKARVLKEGDVFLLSDKRLEDRSCLSKHFSNETNIYCAELAHLRHLQLPNVDFAADRRRQAFWRKFYRLLELGPGGVASQLAARIPLVAGQLAGVGEKAAVVADFHYDWAALRPKIVRDHVTIATATLLSRIDTVALSASDADAARSNTQIVSTRLSEHLSGKQQANLYSQIQKLMEAMLHEYFLQLYKTRTILPQLISEYRLEAALMTICGDGQTYILSQQLKRRGVKTLFYQHGGYITPAISIEYDEVAPATTNFVFGTADAERLKNFNPSRDVRAVGSARFQSMRHISGVNSKKTALYVLEVCEGNGLGIYGLNQSPEPGGINLFKRHLAVIDTFGKRPDWKLSIRRHPSTFRSALYEPLRQYVALRKYKNITFDSFHPSPDVYLEQTNWIIIDSAGTAILEAVAKGLKNVICYIGPPFIVAGEAKDLLMQVVATSSTEEELVAKIDRHLFYGEPLAHDDLARRQFASRFMGPQLAGGPAVEDFILEPLASDGPSLAGA